MIKSKTPAIAALILSVSLTACGGGSGDSDTSKPKTPPQGQVSLTWDTPTTKADGNPLPPGEIGGYRLYLTTSSDHYPTRAYLEIGDRAQTSATLSGLPSGAYFLYVTTYDTNGDESPLSDPVPINL